MSLASEISSANDNIYPEVVVLSPAAIRIIWGKFKKYLDLVPPPRNFGSLGERWNSPGRMGRGEEPREKNSMSARFSLLDKVGLRKHGFVPIIQDKHQTSFPLSSPFTGRSRNS